MLHYAVVCFVVAILTAMYGFSGIPVVATEIAKALLEVAPRGWTVFRGS